MRDNEIIVDDFTKELREIAEMLKKRRLSTLQPTQMSVAGCYFYTYLNGGGYSEGQSN